MNNEGGMTPEFVKAEQTSLSHSINLKCDSKHIAVETDEDCWQRVDNSVIENHNDVDVVDATMSLPSIQNQSDFNVVDPTMSSSSIYRRNYRENVVVQTKFVSERSDAETPSRSNSKLFWGTLSL